jgi:hypothetical protein
LVVLANDVAVFLPALGKSDSSRAEGFDCFWANARIVAIFLVSRIEGRGLIRGSGLI